MWCSYLEHSILPLDTFLCCFAHHILIGTLLASDKSKKIKLALITDLPKIPLSVGVSRELCVHIDFVTLITFGTSFSCLRFFIPQCRVSDLNLWVRGRHEKKVCVKDILLRWKWGEEEVLCCWAPVALRKLIMLGSEKLSFKCMFARAPRAGRITASTLTQL